MKENQMFCENPCSRNIVINIWHFITFIWERKPLLRERKNKAHRKLASWKYQHWRYWGVVKNGLFTVRLNMGGGGCNADPIGCDRKKMWKCSPILASQFDSLNFHLSSVTPIRKVPLEKSSNRLKWSNGPRGWSNSPLKWSNTWLSGATPH